MILDFNVFDNNIFDGPWPKESDDFILWYEICYVEFPWIPIPKIPSPFTLIQKIAAEWGVIPPTANTYFNNIPEQATEWIDIPKGPTGIERC